MKISLECCLHNVSHFAVMCEGKVTDLQIFFSFPDRSFLMWSVKEFDQKEHKWVGVLNLYKNIQLHLLFVLRVCVQSIDMKFWKIFAFVSLRFTSHCF